MERLKYCHLIAKLSQIAGTGKPRGAGADDSYLVAIGLIRLCRLDIMLKRIVRNKTLQLSDGNRVALDAADTFALALGFLRTDTPADCRQRGGLADHLVRLLDIALFYLGNKTRDIDGDRTAGDALCILTVNAARSLFHSLFFIVAVADLLEISRSFLRVLLSDRHSL